MTTPRELWESLVWRCYKRTYHYLEGQIHDVFCHELLDKMGAPRHPNNDPKRPAYSVCGRLKEYAAKQGIVQPSEWL
jgi:hypothetical protein